MPLWHPQALSGDTQDVSGVTFTRDSVDRLLAGGDAVHPPLVDGHIHDDRARAICPFTKGDCFGLEGLSQAAE